MATHSRNVPSSGRGKDVWSPHKTNAERGTSSFGTAPRFEINDMGMPVVARYPRDQAQEWFENQGRSSLREIVATRPPPHKTGLSQVPDIPEMKYNISVDSTHVAFVDPSEKFLTENDLILLKHHMGAVYDVLNSLSPMHTIESSSALAVGKTLTGGELAGLRYHLDNFDRILGSPLSVGSIPAPFHLTQKELEVPFPMKEFSDMEHKPYIRQAPSLSHLGFQDALNRRWEEETEMVKSAPQARIQKRKEKEASTLFSPPETPRAKGKAQNWKSHSKGKDPFKNIGITYDVAYQRLWTLGKIKPIPAIQPKRDNPYYNPNESCAYHSGMIGHHARNCFTLKKKVGKMIDRDAMTLAMIGAWEVEPVVSAPTLQIPATQSGVTGCNRYGRTRG